MSSATEELNSAQNTASTGKRILKVSDDVSGTDKALTLRSAICKIEQLSDNISVSQPLLESTDAALDDLTSAITSIQSIAIAAANGTVTDDVRANYLTQIDSAMETIADIANTKYLDQYIFSGTATDTQAVTEQTGSPPYTYTGDTGVKKVQILNWVTVSTNIPGSQVFNFDESAGEGTTDLFTTVANLRNAIESGDEETVSSQLDNIQANLDNVLNCRSKIGTWIQKSENAEDILADSKLTMQEMLSNVEDADLSTALIDLKTQENIYKAALAVSTQAMSLSLASLDYF